LNPQPATRNLEPLPPQLFPGAIPESRQSLYLHLRQLHYDQCLTAGNQHLAVTGTGDRESAPEPSSLKLVQPAADNQLVPKTRWPAIIDFCADDNRAIALRYSFTKFPAKLFR